MTLSLTSTRQQIESAFANAMTIPVAFQNAPFQPPSNSPWMEVLLSFGQDAPLEWTEDPVCRQPGVVVINVHTPKNTGTQELYQQCEAVRTVILTLKTGRIDGVSFGRPIGPRVTATEDGAWYRGSLQALFRVLYC